MTERRLIELWYSKYEEQTERSPVAPGAKLDGDRVLSGVSVNPEDVQAVAVRFGALELTLEGGATVGVPIINPSQYADRRLAHLRKAAVEVRVQVALSPEDLLPFNEAKPTDDPEAEAAGEAGERMVEDNLLELVREVRDLCADRANACKYDSPAAARADLRALGAQKLLAEARERLLRRGHALGAT